MDKKLIQCIAFKCLVFICLFPYAGLHAISMVYNFRIAQVTRQPIFEKSSDRRNTLIGLLFEQYRKKYNGPRQNNVGGLASYIYDFHPYYIRTDCAVSHIHEKIDHTTSFAGTETDDILFTFGRSFNGNDYTTFTVSGLFGIPTHKIYRLIHTDFGYSQVGTGLQFDGLYEFNPISAFIYGARYIYFFPRKAYDNLGQRYTFTLGNVGDLLVAAKSKWPKHGVEFGYTARFRFGAHICPHLDDIVQKANYIRSNFYFVYQYKFLIHQTSNRLMFNIAYGFDHKSKIFGNKYIITFWASWNLNF